MRRLACRGLALVRVRAALPHARSRAAQPRPSMARTPITGLPAAAPSTARPRASCITSPLAAAGAVRADLSAALWLSARAALAVQQPAPGPELAAMAAIRLLHLSPRKVVAQALVMPQARAILAIAAHQVAAMAGQVQRRDQSAASMSRAKDFSAAPAT